MYDVSLQLIACYFVYALLQSIILARQLKEKTDPVAVVVGLSLFAPLISVILVIGAIRWLLIKAVTYRND